jgi:hypothetical protein
MGRQPRPETPRFCVGDRVLILPTLHQRWAGQRASAGKIRDTAVCWVAAPHQRLIERAVFHIATLPKPFLLGSSFYPEVGLEGVALKLSTKCAPFIGSL